MKATKTCANAAKRSPSVNRQGCVFVDMKSRADQSRTLYVYLYLDHSPRLFSNFGPSQNDVSCCNPITDSGQRCCTHEARRGPRPVTLKSSVQNSNAQITPSSKQSRDQISEEEKVR